MIGDLGPALPLSGAAQRRLRALDLDCKIFASRSCRGPWRPPWAGRWAPVWKACRSPCPTRRPRRWPSTAPSPTAARLWAINTVACVPRRRAVRREHRRGGVAGHIGSGPLRDRSLLCTAPEGRRGRRPALLGGRGAAEVPWSGGVPSRSRKPPAHGPARRTTGIAATPTPTSRQRATPAGMAGVGTRRARLAWRPPARTRRSSSCSTGHRPVGVPASAGGRPRLRSGGDAVGCGPGPCASTANGLGMLIHQAALQFRLWTGSRPVRLAPRRCRRRRSRSDPVVAGRALGFRRPCWSLPTGDANAPLEEEHPTCRKNQDRSLAPEASGCRPEAPIPVGLSDADPAGDDGQTGELQLSAPGLIPGGVDQERIGRSPLTTGGPRHPDAIFNMPRPPPAPSPPASGPRSRVHPRDRPAVARAAARLRHWESIRAVVLSMRQPAHGPCRTVHLVISHALSISRSPEQARMSAASSAVHLSEFDGSCGC